LQALAHLHSGTPGRLTADRRFVIGWLVAAFLGGLVIGLIGLFGYAFVTVQV
jgi:hypothetical protein